MHADGRVYLQRVAGQVDERLVDAEGIIVTAHTPQEALEDGVKVRLARRLPHHVHVALRYHLAAAKALLDEDDCRHLRRCQSHIVNDDALVGRAVLADVEALSTADFRERRLLLHIVDADDVVEVASTDIAGELLGALGVAQGDGGAYQLVVEILGNTVVADGLAHDDGALVGRLVVKEEGQLGEGRGGYREDVGVAGLHVLVLTAQVQCVTGKEAGHAHVLVLCNVALIQDEESVADVECGS